LVIGAIGVLAAPDQFMPIGEARCVTWNRDNLAAWALLVGKEQIPGRWMIVDGEVRPVQ
jgi:hypothetical protein